MSRRVVFGVGPVRELLGQEATAIEQLWLDEGRLRRAEDPVAQLAVAAKQRGVRVVGKPRRELDSLVDREARHQGAIALCGQFSYATWDAVTAQPGGYRRVVVLDGVTDPHNVGAIVRSAYLLGAQAVLLPEKGTAPVNGTVEKAAAGATVHLPIVVVGNLVRTLAELRDDGYWTVVLDGDASSVPIEDVPCDRDLAVIVGAEGAGVRPIVSRAADYRARLPMKHAAVGSFNASVALALALYAVTPRG